jgi:two-component SAPR family response regulator
MSDRRVASVPALPLAGWCVLVIEDEYYLADDIARAFGSLGAVVVGPIGRIEEAEEIVYSKDPDLALLDINIKDEMIFPFARTLRILKVPFVFTTGYDRTMIGSEFDDVPVWQKPLDVTRLAYSLAEKLPTP